MVSWPRKRRSRRRISTRGRLLNRRAADGRAWCLLQSAQRQLRVVVFEPKAFEEVQGIVDQLKNHRPVIINLEETDRALARRIVDFMSGAVYAQAGGMQKISTTIFLFTPANVEISLGPRAEPRDRTSFFNLGN